MQSYRLLRAAAHKAKRCRYSGSENRGSLHQRVDTQIGFTVIHGTCSESTRQRVSKPRTWKQESKLWEAEVVRVRREEQDRSRPCAAATDGRVPDAPARPETEENVAPNGGHQHLPPEAIREEEKYAGDLVATAAHDAQPPDPPERSATERRTACPTGVNSSSHLENLHREGGETSSTRPRSRRSSAQRRRCKESLTQLRRRTRQ